MSVNPGTANQGPQPSPEFSIHIGDLSPETTSWDLVAVFKNPALGLRKDRCGASFEYDAFLILCREPKFIRPFYSCTGGKIVFDPITGVSKGFGFVRCVPNSRVGTLRNAYERFFCFAGKSKY